MCRSQCLRNFSEKKKKTVRIKIRYLALKNSLFLVSTRNDNISRVCVQKMEFPEGMGGPFCEADFGKSRGEGGVIGKIPSVGGYGYFLELHNCIMMTREINRDQAMDLLDVVQNPYKCL